MPFRAYVIPQDIDKGVIVMGTKISGFLAGFLVFFGGRLTDREPSKDAALRELREESQGRLECHPDDTARFEKIEVTDPEPATLFFFRSKNPKYKTGEIPHGREIGSVVAVSVDKILDRLPENPNDVTPEKVANILVEIYGGGADVRQYRASGIMVAMRDFLVKYYYDQANSEKAYPRSA
jgi:8-oxo-dGTP pyrophosphatase MutT (NUDIX family)